MDKKINATPNKAQKDRFMRRANQLVAKSRKSPQYVRDTILTYMNQLHKATFGTRNRKIQNIRDHNLIDTFRETYPREFKIALIKHDVKFGKSNWEKEAKYIMRIDTFQDVDDFIY